MRYFPFIALGLGAAIIVAVMLLLLVEQLAEDPEVGVPADLGSVLHPQFLEDAEPGYVIAELYQDADAAPAIAWVYDASDGSCSGDLFLAYQAGHDEYGPTATPRPTATSVPLPTYAAWAWGNVPPPAVDATPEVPSDPALRMIYATPHPTPLTAPTSTPVPYPTPTPGPYQSSARWSGWENRPLGIYTDGMIALREPGGGSTVSGELVVRVGPNAAGAIDLATFPMPDPAHQGDTFYLDLQRIGGRVHIGPTRSDLDTTYRAAALSLKVEGLRDCSELTVRWQRSAAVVVRALTEQPWVDWGEPAGTPTPTAPPRTEPALFVSVGADATFVAADYTDPNTGASSATLVITPPTAAADSHLSFAVRDDLDPPNGLSDMRETGSPFNLRLAFTPDLGTARTELDIMGVTYRQYITRQAWKASQIGHPWELR